MTARPFMRPVTVTVREPVGLCGIVATAVALVLLALRGFGNG